MSLKHFYRDVAIRFDDLTFYTKIIFPSQCKTERTFHSFCYKKDFLNSFFKQSIHTFYLWKLQSAIKWVLSNRITKKKVDLIWCSKFLWNKMSLRKLYSSFELTIRLSRKSKLYVLASDKNVTISFGVWLKN